MRHHEEGTARHCNKFEGEFQNIIAGRFVEVTCGLIRQKKTRPSRNRPPDCDALLLAARELLRIAASKILQPQADDQFVLPCCIETPRDTSLEGEVITNRQTRDEVQSLSETTSRHFSLLQFAAA